MDYSMVSRIMVVLLLVVCTIEARNRGENDTVGKYRTKLKKQMYSGKKNCSKAAYQTDMLKETLAIMADQLSIKTLVNDYANKKDWWNMRKKLEGVLRRDSPAYKQVESISLTDRSAAWKIGYNGYKELVYVLVLAGGGANMSDGSQGRNLLHGAVAGGHTKLVEMLLENGAILKNGDPALAIAAEHRRLDVAKQLWVRGADINAVNGDDRWTALHYAANNGDLETAKFLVKAGANTKIEGRFGKTPYRLAWWTNNNQVKDYLSNFPH